MRIESVKLDFKDKAIPKVGSLDNASHTPGGGNVMVKIKKFKTFPKSSMSLLTSFSLFLLYRLRATS